MTYLITFSCYGTRLHGDERGSIDRQHNTPGTRTLPPHPNRVAFDRSQMMSAPVILDEKQRKTVLQSILETCRHRNWEPLAVHVRSTHTHILIEAEARPEKIMTDVKAYASRALAAKRVWSRHGSTRWLWSNESIAAAFHYVLEEQGVPMAVHDGLGSRPARP